MSIPFLLLYGTISVSNSATPVPSGITVTPSVPESPLSAAYRPYEVATDPAAQIQIQSPTAGSMGCDPNLIPPAGVMGAHVPRGGEWMFGYRYIYTRYQGMRDGTDHLSSADVLSQGFAQSPTSMTMQMHELEAMYGFTEEFSVMASVPYVLASMPQVDGSNAMFTTHSSGVGDVALSASYAIKVAGDDRLIATMGVSIPTGSINQRDDMPGCPDCRLEYMMQNGSGTVDLLPAFAYVASSGMWGFGAQATGRVRLGTNDNDYRLGDRGDITAWAARRLGDSLRASLRLAGSKWGNVNGADPELDLAMSPTNDPNRQGGSRVDVALGFDWLVPSGRHSGSGIGIEFGVPVYQYLDGPQPDAAWFATIGMRFMF